MLKESSRPKIMMSALDSMRPRQSSRPSSASGVVCLEFGLDWGPRLKPTQKSKTMTMPTTLASQQFLAGRVKLYSRNAS